MTVLASETAFFGTLLMAYLYLSLSNSVTPQPALTRLIIPTINTAILLVSAGTAWLSNRSIRQGNVPALQRLLMITLALGLLFVAAQIYEFTRSGMLPDDREFGGVYFALIGFHALHVLAGVIVLVINLLRARLGDFSARRHIAVEMGTWFWFYVTGVWLVLFTVLFVVR